MKERDVVIIVKGRFKGKVPSSPPDCLFVRQHGQCDSANNVDNQQPGQKGGELVLSSRSLSWSAAKPCNQLCWHDFGGDRGTGISGQEECWQDECQGLLCIGEDKLRKTRSSLKELRVFFFTSVVSN